MSALHIFYAVLVVAFWGANFVASKFALAHFPPAFSTFLRFFFLCIVLLPFLPRIKREHIGYLILMSMLGVAHFMLPQAALAAGLDIATCALLNQLCVPFACLLSVIILNEHIGRWRVLGLILSFAGMVLILGSPHFGDNWLGTSYAIAAALFFSVYNLLLKRHADISGMQILGYVCLFAAPQALLISLIFEQPTIEMITTASWLPWLGIAYTVIFSTVFSHGMWNYLIRLYPMSKVAPFTLLVPVFGALFGRLFFDEPMTWQLIVGGAITMAGVAIIVIRRPKLLLQAD